MRSWYRGDVFSSMAIACHVARVMFTGVAVGAVFPHSWLTIGTDDHGSAWSWVSSQCRQASSPGIILGPTVIAWSVKMTGVWG